MLAVPELKFPLTVTVYVPASGLLLADPPDPEPPHDVRVMVRQASSNKSSAGAPFEKSNLLGSAEEHRLYHGFNFRGHLLGWNPLRRLIPGAGGTEDRPGGGSRKQLRIDAGFRRVMAHPFTKHFLYDRNNGAFERHLRQLARTSRSFSEVIANTQRNGAQC